MLTYEKISANTKNLDLIEALYSRAFPANERVPFPHFLDGYKYRDFLAFYDEDLFVGFLAVLNNQDISHIIYFAVPEELRGKGYGSQILQTIHQVKSGRRILVDIEKITPDSKDNEQRQKRKNFYLRNGYRETEVSYVWREEAYEILVHGGKLPREDFRTFWRTLP